MPGQTSSTLLRGASVNPSKTRFSLRNTSHAFADELLPAGLMGSCCKPDSKLECAKVDRPQVENRELALSNAKRGQPAPKNGIWVPLLIPISGDVYSKIEEIPQSRLAMRQPTRRGEGRGA